MNIVSFGRRLIMKNFDIKSLCIGFLSASLIFTLMGAKEKSITFNKERSKPKRFYHLYK